MSVVSLPSFSILIGLLLGVHEGYKLLANLSWLIRKSAGDRRNERALWQRLAERAGTTLPPRATPRSRDKGSAGCLVTACSVA